MSIKDRLAQNSQQPTVSAQQPSYEDFNAHYRKLWRNISGVSFSFGDTRLLRKALHNIARTFDGQDLLMQVPETLPIGSKRKMHDPLAGAYYDMKENELFVKSDEIKSEKSINGVSESVMRLLKHELRHAAQDARGMFMEGKKLSVEQVGALDKLAESETRAWEIMDSFMSSYFRFDSQENFDATMKAFMSAEFDPQYAPKELEFQKLLRDNKGDVLKAQKTVVGKMIAESMAKEFNQDMGWRLFYEKQALRNISSRIVRKDISAAGNDEAFDQALSYFTKEYGIQKKDINKINATEKHTPIFEGLKHGVETGTYDPKTVAFMKNLLKPNSNSSTNASSIGQSIQAPRVPTSTEHTSTTDHTAMKMPHTLNKGR